MIIIVDGYNLLKQVFYYSPAKIKGDIDKIRSRLINNLALYKQKKGHEVIVVFDGGSTSKATREISNGIVTIFSGYKKSADEWILEYIEKHSPGEFLLVTNDRKLIDLAKKFGSDSLDVFSFHQIVLSSIGEMEQKEMLKKSNISNVQKYSYEDDLEAENKWNVLDFLIAQSDVSKYSKDDLEKELVSEKDKSHQPTKEEKRIFKKIKKL